MSVSWGAVMFAVCACLFGLAAILFGVRFNDLATRLVHGRPLTDRERRGAGIVRFVFAGLCVALAVTVLLVDAG